MVVKTDYTYIVSNYIIFIVFCAIQISCISTSTRNCVHLLGKKNPAYEEES